MFGLLHGGLGVGAGAFHRDLVLEDFLEHDLHGRHTRGILDEGPRALEQLAAGRSVVLAIDVQGGRQIKAIYPDAVMIFILPPDEKTLAERLGKRARDSAETVEKRLSGARREIATAKQYYDKMVINKDLERAIDEVMRIITDAT